MKLDKHILNSSVAALALLIVIPTSPAAQVRSNLPNRPTPLGPSSDATRDMQERDMNIRRLEIERDSNKKPTFEVSKETIKQVNEDFARIQEINLDIMHDYVSGIRPNYKHIAAAMAEINKCAARLNTNLLLPPGDAAANDQASPSGLTKRPARSPLLDLNDLITRFVTNPIFKNSGTIDATTGAKAKRDLEEIIDLSDRISKSADKLSRQQNKPN
jgi:hypothetical protein